MILPKVVLEEGISSELVRNLSASLWLAGIASSRVLPGNWRYHLGGEVMEQRGCESSGCCGQNGNFREFSRLT